jgi:predicted aldo/keto reductase-like oxidoreductase
LIEKGRAMQYRKFGKLDWQASQLGFGAMRLPVIDKNQAMIDEPEATRMLRYAIDNGVNYIDSAYLYHMGHSEPLVAKALQDGYREKVKVATKLPPNSVESPRDFDRIFDEQLSRLQRKKMDLYLLHGINARTWAKIRDMDVIQWAERQMAAGRIDHLGFSFHDDYDVFKEIIDYYDNWTFCQIQYNYMDVDKQAGRRGVEYAAGKGLAIVVMEPIRGGVLSKNQPPQVENIWQTDSYNRSLAERALLWVWNQPEISVVLSGMSTMEQVMENVAIADRARPDMFTPEELETYDKVREAYSGLRPVPCTGCGYCLPCTNAVDIPRIFQLYNDSVIYDDYTVGRFRYQGPGGVKEENRADRCEECEICMDACPQKIAIPYELKKAHIRLMKTAP